MKSLPNLEKSAFRKGQYVAYAARDVWNVRRGGPGWVATATYGELPRIEAATLAQISSKLESLT